MKTKILGLVMIGVFYCGYCKSQQAEAFPEKDKILNTIYTHTGKWNCATPRLEIYTHKSCFLCKLKCSEDDITYYFIKTVYKKPTIVKIKDNKIVVNVNSLKYNNKLYKLVYSTQLVDTD